MAVTARPLIVCADDFGMSPSINAGILELLTNGRISAVACLVTGAHWADGARDLRSCSPTADIGLHLSLPQWSYPAIVRRAWLRQFTEAELLRTIRQQYAQLEQHLQRPPDFIDGHQHIHQLPVIKSALLGFVRELNRTDLYIRNSAMQGRDIWQRRMAVPKNMLIAGLARPFKSTLDRHGLPTNQDFLGVYNFNTGLPMQTIVRHFIEHVRGPNPLFMLHPARPSDGRDADNDPIARRRETEHRYFAGPDFAADLEACALRPGRFDFSAAKPS